MKYEYIICENKAERDAVLAKLENEGYKWGNKKPLTEWNLNDTWGDQSIALHPDKKLKAVLWAFTRSEHRQRKDAVLAQDYLSKHNPILITRKGRVVTAEDKNTGEKAIATCCPTDTFDFGTGAMIAVARLIAQSDKGITKDAETVLRQLLGYDAESSVDIPTEEASKPFKVGSLVTLRPDVKPGIEYNGLTLQPGDMYDIACGKPIKVIRYDSGDQTYLCEAKGAERMWWYDSDMLEAWDESKPEMPTTKFKVGDLVTLREGVKEGDHFGHLDVEYGVMFDQGYHKPIKVIEISKAGSYLCVPAKGNGTDFYYHEEMLEKWDENKIYEGDIVRVINTGLNYSAYPQWVGEHISDPDMAARYCFGSPSDGGNYKVIKIAEHESNGRTLAYIEQCDGFVFNRCYLVEIKGLEKVTE